MGHSSVVFNNMIEGDKKVGITHDGKGKYNDFNDPRDRNNDGDKNDPGDKHGGVDFNYANTGQAGSNLTHPDWINIYYYE